jgi:mRNA-degrading endonuclease toxin of MazEF toxin-antitoxin module
MRGPHYALVLSADLHNVATGLAVACPITSKVGKLSDFELPVRAGRVNGAAILSDYARSTTRRTASSSRESCQPPTSPRPIGESA